MRRFLYGLALWTAVLSLLPSPAHAQQGTAPVVTTTAYQSDTGASIGLALRLSPSESKSTSDDYFYCVLIDESQSKRVFFTAVFLGNNSEQRTLEASFSAFVSARYRGVHDSASCRFDKSRSAATTKREDDKAAAGREGRAVIETNWRPVGS